MKLVCELRREDFAAAYRAVADGPALRPNRNRTVATLGFAATFVGGIAWLLWEPPPLGYALAVLAAMFAVRAAKMHWGWPEFVAQQGLRADDAGQRWAGRLGRVEATIDAEGFRLRDGAGEWFRRWQYLGGVVPADERLLIVVDAKQCLSLPRKTVLEGDFAAFSVECERRWREARTP